MLRLTSWIDWRETNHMAAARGSALLRGSGTRPISAANNVQEQTVLILASQSPRRRQLLTALGVHFVVASANVDESAQPGESPYALVQRLARSKAQAVAQRHPGRIVLGADTIVVLDEAVLGKPVDAAEATAMLQRLRRRSHTVMSAVYALNQAADLEASAVSISQVWMRDYTDAEIAAYVASGDPLDKAGAYAIQSQSFAPVARVEGCFSGVMGFPLAEVACVLAAVGISVPGSIVQVCPAAQLSACCQAAHLAAAQRR